MALSMIKSWVFCIRHIGNAALLPRHRHFLRCVLSILEGCRIMEGNTRIEISKGYNILLVYLVRYYRIH